MENRNLAIGITIASILLCGLPGLMTICVSVLFVVDGPFPEELAAKWLIGLIIFFSGFILIAIPVLVGVFSLRRKKVASTKLPPAEPIPPPN